MLKPINIFENINFVDDKWNKVIVIMNEEGTLINSEWIELIKVGTLENYLFVNVISKLKFDDFELSLFRKVFELEKSKDNTIDVEKQLININKMDELFFWFSDEKKSVILAIIFNNISIQLNETINIGYDLKPLIKDVVNRNK